MAYLERDLLRLTSGMGSLANEPEVVVISRTELERNDSLSGELMLLPFRKSAILRLRFRWKIQKSEMT